MDRQDTTGRDLKSGMGTIANKSIYRHHHLLTVAGAILAIGIIIGLVPDDAGATRSESTGVISPIALPAVDTLSGPELADDTARITLPLELPVETSAGSGPSVIQDAAGRPDDDAKWTSTKVRNGDNLSTIFGRYGISARELQNILALGGDTRSLRNLFPGEEIRFQTGVAGELLTLTYDVDDSHTLWLQRSPDGFAAHTVEHVIERRVVQASGVINDSLFLASQRAGLSDNLTMELATIFGWDVDFSLDIRSGDRFSVVYEELYKNGERLREGNILAAEFVNRDKVFRAVRYLDGNGQPQYYSPQGKSLRKAFLRSPVAFTRISSGFSLGRMHPVLNRIRAHKGVDYAAPIGTPVKSTGDGKILFRGVKGGYGNVVIVQHGSRYSTLYGHLSAFARGVYAGKRVRQGEVIAYVGMTGLATGPHLHYEFRIDGIHHNPLTVAFPDAAPLSSENLAKLARQSQPYLARLDVLGRMQTLLMSSSDRPSSGEHDPIVLNAME